MPQFRGQINGRHTSRQVYRSLLHALSTLALLAVITIVLAACAGVNDSGSHPDFIETQTAAHTDGEGGEGSPEPGGDATEPAGAVTEPAGGATEPTGAATEATGGSDDLVATGKELATTNNCAGCHSIDGTAGAGPTWQGLYGHEVTLDDGSTVTADDAYITESIRDPGAKIVDGFTNIMPTTFADFSDDQVNAIIAYIKSLE